MTVRARSVVARAAASAETWFVTAVVCTRCAMSRRGSEPGGNSARARRPAWQTAVPRIRDEEPHIAGFGLQHRRWATVVRQVQVPHRAEGREPSRTMTPRNDRGRPVGPVAVLEIDVRRDGEHRIRNAVVPVDSFGARHMGTGIAMPRSTRELGRISPCRVRDHVTVVAQQRLDDRKDRGIRHGGLAGGAAIEHLVPELVLVVAYPLRRGRVEHCVDLAAQLCDRAGIEHSAELRVPVAFELCRFLRRVRPVEESQVLEQSSDHAPTVGAAHRVRQGRRLPRL